jgi:hypothetical protein
LSFLKFQSAGDGIEGDYNDSMAAEEPWATRGGARLNEKTPWARIDASEQVIAQPRAG